MYVYRCMYVYMYIYVYICIYVWVCVYIFLLNFKDVCSYMFDYIWVVLFYVLGFRYSVFYLGNLNVCNGFDFYGDLFWTNNCFFLLFYLCWLLFLLIYFFCLLVVLLVFSPILRWFETIVLCEEGNNIACYTFFIDFLKECVN